MKKINTVPQQIAIVRQISQIRASNNHLWMSLLEIALKHASKETKKILGEITKNDRKITGLTRKLVGK